MPFILHLRHVLLQSLFFWQYLFMVFETFPACLERRTLPWLLTLGLRGPETLFCLECLYIQDVR